MRNGAGIGLECISLDPSRLALLIFFSLLRVAKQRMVSASYFDASETIIINRNSKFSWCLVVEFVFPVSGALVLYVVLHQRRGVGIFFQCHEF